ncbi:MAG: sugar phosphate isomerase/epimerase family protein [Monoglobaceae bacterium]
MNNNKNQMKLSTTTSALFSAFGYKAGIELAAKVGFDALDLNLTEIIYTDDFSDSRLEDTCRMLKTEAEIAGICFNQAHAPFPCFKFNNSPDAEAYNQRIAPALRAAIKAAGLVGAEAIVIHPIDCASEPSVNQLKFNLNFYNSLKPFCEEYGVMAALENMWGYSAESGRIVKNVCSTAEDLSRYYDALDPKYFTVCLDVGHSELVGESATDAIKILGGRLHALHIHDNDKISDLHTIPYQGSLDWDEICSALCEIGYSGDFTYEVGGRFLAPYIDKPRLMEKAFALLAETGKYLIQKCI